ncbi:MULTISPECIES: response regulator [Pseudomonas]|uniref:Response regulator transcription factor n=1 Tax=Pseudomonas nitroreducens TaxID=46680 RepID=A0ABS0KTQ9_PSENT|nr:MULTISPECIES: response regulator transcription factor [Pseudomonas]MBG6290777.1 response regulator transcription factor [Pseudomonas nitroreducens]MCJ1878404.1 response regulator transcription factor [Pseudomonas nitroreducens]MCJ1894777.1 response regulator transcription factor [Pseudomonas nitroreducens]NMZ59310.1 response regulator transcription factor [Pseudomonas nitroreducens]NNN24781.1 response regulator transcription factor [Pseudomonas nitroreducens]
MKILLVDDHFVVRDGVAALLRGLIPEVEVSEAIDGESALEAVQRSVPSLVILDIGLPGISGLEVTRRLRQRLPQLRVLFFSMHDELPLVRQALDAGAAGYITKGASPAVLVEAVRRILAGHAYIEQPLATQLARQPRGADGQDPRLQGMTQREFEIFVMLARGLPVRQVAEHLCISAKTVSNHVTLLKQKLQVVSHAELVHLAIDTGVLRVGGEAIAG